MNICRCGYNKCWRWHLFCDCCWLQFQLCVCINSNNDFQKCSIHSEKTNFLFLFQKHLTQWNDWLLPFNAINVTYNKWKWTMKRAELLCIFVISYGMFIYMLPNRKCWIGWASGGGSGGGGVFHMKSTILENKRTLIWQISFLMASECWT